MYVESSIQLSNIPAICNLFQVLDSPKGDLTGERRAAEAGVVVERNGEAPLCC